jgi:hypothetical protein
MATPLGQKVFSLPSSEFSMYYRKGNEQHILKGNVWITGFRRDYSLYLLSFLGKLEHIYLNKNQIALPNSSLRSVGFLYLWPLKFVLASKWELPAQSIPGSRKKSLSIHADSHT